VCCSGAVLGLRGDDVDGWYLVLDQSVMIFWWIQIGWLNSYHLRLWQIFSIYFLEAFGDMILLLLIETHVLCDRCTSSRAASKG
jgi:hypothetical protein